jgi:hygromycin-B 4-O-kinase
MMTYQERLVEHATKYLFGQSNTSTVSFPPQGMSSHVFFLQNSGTEYAVKYGRDAHKDIVAIDLIHSKKPSFPVPKIVTHFCFEDIPVLVMEKLSFPLLDSIAKDMLGRYIPSLISMMKELHTMKSKKPAHLYRGELESWRDYVLSFFDGRALVWDDVFKRKVLDEDLVRVSIDKMIRTLQTLDMDFYEFSLLHTDINQRNIFVDTVTKKIAGVIDWEDAVYGDPVYDFARVRMLLWHFGVDGKVVEEYYKLVDLSEKEKERERAYWVMRVIQYLAWYSEELSPFALSRIQLHQDFLRKYQW